MIRDSYIYNGEVIHKRFKPKVHYFRYKVFSLLIDLDELNILNNSKSTSADRLEAAIIAPTMITDEIALVTDIKGVCNEGVTLHTT